MARSLTRVAARIAKRFEKIAMAVIIQNIAKHDWGWYSREDPRMHLQTVGTEAYGGRGKAKVWLEDKGKRIFEPIPTKLLSASDWKKLEDEVTKRRLDLEGLWIIKMISNGWLEATLKGSIVELTAYPGTHNSFIRTIDLRKIFPGVYKGDGSWDKFPPIVDLDAKYSALRVGKRKNPDERNHIELNEYIFKN